MSAKPYWHELCLFMGDDAVIRCICSLFIQECACARRGIFLRFALPWYYLFVISAVLIVAIFGPLVDHNFIFMNTMVVCARCIYTLQLLMPQINEVSDVWASDDVVAAKRFNISNGLSIVINFVQIVAVEVVLARFL